ncbi:MAG: hypothetical protein GC185_09035 [Alphaproteobacteria bacterium]|nr:hypothetical protein [Alphaproteobacteria bacterium]
MSRTRISAYLAPELAEALTRVAALKNTSVSELVEDAIARSFSQAGRDAEHAATLAKLDMIARRLARIEHRQDCDFELCAHVARFVMSLAPDIPEEDRAVLNARGAGRLNNVIQAITSRLAAGKSLWRDRFAHESPTASQQSQPEAQAQ